jgi:hypothetical protein
LQDRICDAETGATFMTITRLIGDVHGKFQRYKTLLADSPHPTIQVGDMGVGFRRWPHGDASANPPHMQMVAGGHRFIRGNHDNPATCKTQSQYIPDGTVENGVMFVGGAVSIDRAYRNEGYSWWPDEELSEDELLGLIGNYCIDRPRVMITHECPESIAGMIVAHLCGGNPKMDPRFASRTRIAFERMLSIHAPKLWIFGHWHVPFDYIHQGTRFICLPELSFIDVDLEEV